MTFSPLHTFAGGTLLSLASSSFLSDIGRVFGISSIVAESFWGDGDSWRLATTAGLIFGPTLGKVFGLPGAYASEPLSGWFSIPWTRASLAGLLVGFGSRLGSGCTSGHFLCGVSRGSPRSLVATATFFLSAVLTANLVPMETPYPSWIPKPNPFTIQTGLAYAPLITVPILAGLVFTLRSTLARSGSNPPRIIRLAPYFLAGLTFSFGLLISGMADPRKVLHFLTPFSPRFDPSLAMIVLGGVVPNALYWNYTPKGKVQYPWEEWRIPTRTDIDRRLMAGSMIFGIGWGLAGVCPGPAIVGIGKIVQGIISGEDIGGPGAPLLAFILSMIMGMGAGGAV
ncbi:hypothetical protein BD324DRAFT_581517 [Kockovaella imperatae]|uniref:Uncharacterized protein n=1 Tax=Kockovaella imperatae TaxID=4999 RepID=A0A1Y1UDD5_9TREE|nr:hypothetical protein BD324DRAFT_581517 [Kockovaella imperatae]ORX36050.1 hypothetical protein BD324DRAFT_581517 [Kockovaella imperatae]